GEAGGGAGVAAPGGVVRAAATLGALLAYALALEPVGFGVATFLLIVFLFRAIEPQPWLVALGGAAATVLACHVLFRVWLGVRLPPGPWGF
ncbi:MAG: tripartite tricarboxylate transporter TctB family protein, partial [Burkholderiales bacterium]